MYKKKNTKKLKRPAFVLYTFSLTHNMLFGNVVNKSSKLNNTTIQLLFILNPTNCIDFPNLTTVGAAGHPKILYPKLKINFQENFLV